MVPATPGALNSNRGLTIDVSWTKCRENFYLATMKRSTFLTTILAAIASPFVFAKTAMAEAVAKKLKGEKPYIVRYRILLEDPSTDYKFTMSPDKQDKIASNFIAESLIRDGQVKIWEDTDSRGNRMRHYLYIGPDQK